MDIKGGKIKSESFLEKVEEKEEKPSTQTQLELVLGLLAKDAEFRNEEREKKAEILKKQHEARVEAAKTERAMRNQEQDACRHQKQDGRPRIGGQQLSDGTFVYFCQWCQKKWQYPLQEGMEPLPAHLQNINGDMVGSSIR